MPDGNEEIAANADQSSDPAKGPSRRERILTNLAFLRSGLLSAVAVLAVVAMLVVAIRDLTRAPIVLEEIGVTTSLSQEGYTGLVASNMLWDAIEEIRSFTGDSKQNVRIQTASRQLDVVEPGSGLSLQRITKVLRSLFNLPQTRIAGEFVCLESTCAHDDMSLRIRIFSGDGTRVISAGAIDGRTMEEYFHDTALHLLEEEIDPLVAARYYYFDTSNDWSVYAVKISTELLLQRGETAEEAATLLGFAALDRQEYDQALAYSEAAIAVGDEVRRQQGFWSRRKDDWKTVRAQSLLLKGQVLSEKGYFSEQDEMQLQAMDLFEQAAELAPDYGFIRTAQARTMEDLEQYDDAIAFYQMAVEVDKLDPYAWSELGRALLAADAPDEAAENFRIAKSLAPDDPFLLRYHATDQNIDNALADAKLWAKDAPQDPQAWGFWLDVLDEKLYLGDETSCDRPYGSVAELQTTANTIAPFDMREDADAFAYSVCGWTD
ncbi:tetratricopeptide repeat protein [uncultured Roseobacter sp.]|uniref:tetratricopeptide repeat protein n=1 Tax=uncultured Roseobacter sp. TaxID=114847 RepID=UPI00263289D6|nr:hypothetical protein [uncultured Roseobacter sp.]